MTHKRTLTLQIPYCADCAARIRQRQQMTPWVRALLLFMGVWMGGTLVATLLGAALKEVAPIAIVLLVPLSCAAPFVAAWLYMAKARLSRVASLPAPHICGTADAVSIVSFDKESVTVSVSRDEFATALRSANPGTAA